MIQGAEYWLTEAGDAEQVTFCFRRCDTFGVLAFVFVLLGRQEPDGDYDLHHIRVCLTCPAIDAQALASSQHIRKQTGPICLKFWITKYVPLLLLKDKS